MRKTANRSKPLGGGSLLVFPLAATALVASATFATIATNDTYADGTLSIQENVNVTVDSACSIASDGSGTYAQTITPGAAATEFGNHTFTVVCNDAGGWYLSAVGSGSGTSVSDLYNSTAGLSIATGTATSGSTSNWAFNATAVSGTYTPTIDYASDYAAVPTTSTKIAHYDGATDSTGSSLSLKYRIYAQSAQAAGTYTGQVTYTLQHPVPPDLTTISNMQDMTATICNNSTVGQTNTLKDTRDNKYYYVAKLADNKCWMTQNLDLDITTAGLTNADTDLNSKTAWDSSSTDAPQATEITTSSSSTATDTKSWNLGDYAYDGTTNSSCGTSATSYADCTSYGFSATSSPTVAANHYHVGNLYQWNTATAGSGGEITESEARDSICPKGWRLPTGGSTGEFQALVTAYSAGSSPQTLINSPLYFVRGGSVLSGTLSYAGSGGFYWSSTSGPTTNYAYYFYFISTGSVAPSYNYYRYYGYSVRCVAR